MGVLVYIFIGLLFILLQTTVFMVHPLWAGAPDLYFVLVAFLAYRVDLLRGLIIILPISWVMDIFSGVIIGTYPAICFLAFFFLKLMDAKMPVRESYYQVPLVGVTYLVVSKVVYTVLSFLAPETLAPWSWPRMLLRVSLLVLFAWPLFWVLELIDKRLQKKISPFSVLRVRGGNRYRQERDSQ